MNEWAEKAEIMLRNVDTASSNKSLELASVYATLALNKTLDDIGHELATIANGISQLPTKEDLQNIADHLRLMRLS